MKKLLPALRWIAGFCAVVATLGAAESALSTSPAEFHALLERYYDESIALNPVDAAANGDSDRRYEDVWPVEIGAEHRARLAAMCDRYLAELDRFDRAALPETDQLSLDMLRWSLGLRRESTRQVTYLTPVNQFYCPTLTFAQMASGSYIHPFRTAQDYRNFLSRARGFSTWVDTAIANMREGVARGIVAPRAIMQKVLPELAPLMADDPEKNILFGPLGHLPSNLPPAERVKLSVEYADGIRAVMLPAYRRLHDFIRDEYLPHSRTTAGLGDMPGGAQAYAFAVRWHTTTDLTPAQIHELGVSEVARIRAEMLKVQAKVGFKGTLAQFLAYVATDPKFAPYKTDDEVLNGYRAIESRVMARVPEYFGHLPKMKFEIRPTEKFRAASASVEYIAGVPDGSRPGIFYVPILDPRKCRTTRMEDLFLHEAIPGHHFQLSLALENATLPRFRRYEYNNAYVEGWALYCESLGPELGMYADPYQYLGMLLGDMNRAVRLVVDTGMHALGWTREQAMRYSAEQVGGTPEDQAGAIERYMAMPGQALAYKIGQLKIRELRTLAEQKLGARFDVRAFHDMLLSEGSLPLPVLEARVRTWIARQ